MPRPFYKDEAFYLRENAEEDAAKQTLEACL